MAETIRIEAIVAEKGRKEGEGGKDAAAPPKEGKVGGLIGEGDLSFARTVGLFVMPRKRCSLR